MAVLLNLFSALATYDGGPENLVAGPESSDASTPSRLSAPVNRSGVLEKLEGAPSNLERGANPDRAEGDSATGEGARKGRVETGKADGSRR